MSGDIQQISELPSLNEILKRSQGLALLDAIIMPEWQYRYFSFNCKWNEECTEMMASMRDGCGSEYFLHFSASGCVGKVFDEQLLSDSDFFLKYIPPHFSRFKNESAFKLNDATFYFWQSANTGEWVAQPQNLNSYPCLRFLKERVNYYHHWAESYYEKNIDLETLQDVFKSLSVTQQQLAILNPNLTIEDLDVDLHEILGVPYAIYSNATTSH